MAIARERRVRWVLVTDLVPRMNDYSGYLGKAPVLESGPEGASPTRRYFETMQSRLYDFDGQGARIPGGAIPPLSSFRLRFRSQSAIPRGNRWIARWKVFEVVPADSAPSHRRRPGRRRRRGHNRPER